MKKLLSTKEVAEFLGVNEKMVYSLVAEKGLPASKVTGKWIFPLHLVEQWVETNTLNYPQARQLPPYDGLLIITGSNDLLLDKTISLFNRNFSGDIAVFANLGSMGGLQALRRNTCHIATSHLLQDNGDEYNFDFAGREFNNMPVIVNFCRREQGFLIQKGNPETIKKLDDIRRSDIRVVNRSLSTGTRLLFDRELQKAGIESKTITGYDHEVNSHMEVGLEVLSGRAHLGPGIRPVATLLELDFIPLRWERYDLLITKEHFFDKGIQNFIGLLQENEFKQMAESITGYDVSSSGKIIYPQETSA
ncbi:MAG: helix-turn-helix transcriptional regulator [Desulfobacteraceae bacterium]|nr:helix-turn-helix transcriptional regulator [Desulfobacteraceae bacterium]MBC2754780.1 helix-turn-helix transcriptional regulator [Desulfobacteraceae bacterium]